MIKVYAYTYDRAFNLVKETKNHYKVAESNNPNITKIIPKSIDEPVVVYDTTKTTLAQAKKSNKSNLHQNWMDRLYAAFFKMCRRCKDNFFAITTSDCDSIYFSSTDLPEDDDIEVFSFEEDDDVEDILKEFCTKFSKDATKDNDFFILETEDVAYCFRKSTIKQTIVTTNHLNIQFFNNQIGINIYRNDDFRNLDEFIKILDEDALKIDIASKVCTIKDLIRIKTKFYEETQRKLDATQKNLLTLKKVYDSFSDSEKLLGEICNS